MTAPASIEDRPPGVRPLSSVLKTLAVLDLLGQSPQPMRLADLARALGGGRATVYQRLVTLQQAGWVEQAAGGYRLTMHAARMGESALRQASLGERSNAVLQALVAETEETASLAILNGVHAELVQRVEVEAVLKVERRIGTLLSLDQSASGRVLTAFASPALRAQLGALKAKLAPEAALRETRRKGHAVSTGRDIPGVQSVAVPVFDASGGCAYALSIVAPVARFDGARYVKPLERAACRLQELIAGRPPGVTAS